MAFVECTHTHNNYYLLFFKDSLKKRGKIHSLANTYDEIINLKIS